MSTYNNVANNLLMGCENSLGIYTSLEGKTLEVVSIEEFCTNYSKLIKEGSLDSSAHVKCGEYLTSLCYLNSICNYSRISVLDFSNHLGTDKLANFLIPFGKKKNLNKKTLELTTSVVKYLLLLEKQSSSSVSSMCYRFIRLFVALVWRHDYASASIVSRFLLDQLFLGSGLDDSVKQKAKEIKRARKEVDRKLEKDGVEPKKVVKAAAAVKSFIDTSVDVVDTVTGRDRVDRQQHKNDANVSKNSADQARLEKLRKISEKHAKKVNSEPEEPSVPLNTEEVVESGMSSSSKFSSSFKTTKHNNEQEIKKEYKETSETKNVDKATDKLDPKSFMRKED